MINNYGAGLTEDALPKPFHEFFWLCGKYAATEMPRSIEIKLSAGAAIRIRTLTTCFGSELYLNYPTLLYQQLILLMLIVLDNAAI